MAAERGWTLELGCRGEGAIPSRIVVGVRDRERFDPGGTRALEDAPPARGDADVVVVGEERLFMGGGRVNELPLG